MSHEGLNERRPKPSLKKALIFAAGMAAVPGRVEREPVPANKHKTEEVGRTHKALVAPLQRVPFKEPEVQSAQPHEEDPRKEILTALDHAMPERRPFTYGDVIGEEGDVTQGNAVDAKGELVQFFYNHTTHTLDLGTTSSHKSEVAAPAQEEEPEKPEEEQSKYFSPLDSDTFFDAKTGIAYEVDVEKFRKLYGSMPPELADAYNDMLKLCEKPGPALHISPADDKGIEHLVLSLENGVIVMGDVAQDGRIEPKIEFTYDMQGDESGKRGMTLMLSYQQLWNGPSLNVHVLRHQGIGEIYEGTQQFLNLSPSDPRYNQAMQYFLEVADEAFKEAEKK